MMYGPPPRNVDYHKARTIMKNRGLTANAKILFMDLWIVSSELGKQSLKLSNEEISELCQMSTASVKRAIRPLQDEGLLSVRTSADKKWRTLLPLEPHYEKSKDQNDPQLKDQNDPQLKDQNDPSTIWREESTKVLSKSDCRTMIEFNQNEMQGEFVLTEKAEKETIKRDARYYREIRNLWNRICAEGGLPPCHSMQKARRRLVRDLDRTCEREGHPAGLDFYESLFTAVTESAWLMMKLDKRRPTELNWVLNPENAFKVLEGKYQNQNQNYGKGITEFPPEIYQGGEEEHFRKWGF